MAAMLEVRNLRKRFGAQVALNNLSFAVPERSVTAFVGANGAGKTTTFSLIGGFFRADHGEILVRGEALEEFRSAGGFIGLLPQDAHFFEGRTLERQLLLFARLVGLTGAAARDEVARVLELVQLSDRARATEPELSHGMKVRFGVAQALIGNPPLVLLDEPTAGLDPIMVAAFRELIAKIKGQTTIVISSHDLGQLEQMCDYVCMINQGLLVKQGSLKELLNSSAKIVFRVTRDPDLAALRAVLSDLKFSNAAKECLTVEFDPRVQTLADTNARVFGWLSGQKIGVLAIESQAKLEDQFIQSVKRA